MIQTGLPLMKNVIKPLAKSVLIPLGLTAAASAASAGIHKKILGSGKHTLDLALPKHNNTTTLIISNDEIEDIIKIVKSLEESALFLKEVSKTIQNEAKEHKKGFLSMLLGTLGSSLLGNIFAGKGAITKRQGREVIRAEDGAIAKRQGRGFIKTGYGSKLKTRIFNAASSFN